MMRIKFSPQLNNEIIQYAFNGDTITATIGNITDTFDFTGMPDGEVGGIETILPFPVIVKAVRDNGVLSVELLNFIGEDATEEEKFPEWLEV